jgi:hypothetical protein
MANQQQARKDYWEYLSFHLGKYISGNLYYRFFQQNRRHFQPQCIVEQMKLYLISIDIFVLFFIEHLHTNQHLISQVYFYVQYIDTMYNYK